MIGEMEWLKEKEYFTMPMGMFTLVSFTKIELMGTEFMFIPMDKNMKVFGKMTCKMDQVRKN